MNWKNLIISILALLILGHLYKNILKKKIDNSDYSSNLNLIQKFLLGDIQTKTDIIDTDNDSCIKDYILNSYDSSEDLIKNLGNIKKPIIWIYVDYKYNTRKWSSFYSRSSRHLNMEYLYLTVKSIINNCGKDFYICIIDDNTLNKIIPDFNVDLSIVGEPVKTHIKDLALLNVLYLYGGILLENSFICLKSIKPLYNSILENDKPIIGEFICEGITNISQIETIYKPSMKFIGCKKNCNTMYNIIQYFQNLNIHDYTADMDFNGKLENVLNNLLHNNDMILIPGNLIGTKTLNNKPVIIEDLFSSNVINFDCNMYLLYIPRDKILKMNKYNWLANINIKEILLIDNNISYYLIKANTKTI